MRATLVFLAAGLAAVVAAPRSSQRIVGGLETNIEQYAFAASILYSRDLVTYSQLCGGSILTARSILSAAHCYISIPATNRWRVRVGSTYANSGGIVHLIGQITGHPGFSSSTMDNDVAILRTATNIVYSVQVTPVAIAGANYNLADNQVVWAIGWGLTAYNGQASEVLRHVQIWTVNQDTCRIRYDSIGSIVTDNMLCSGWLDVGGRDQCQGDSGGPLIHDGRIVGVTSWGENCGLPYYPGVNARVSRYAAWIVANV